MTLMPSAQPRRKLTRRIVGALAAMIVATAGFIAMPAANAVEVVGLTWNATSPTTQPSGTKFSVLASISCSAVAGTTCNNLKLVIPFDPALPTAAGATKVSDYVVSASSAPTGLVFSTPNKVGNTWEIPLRRSLTAGESVAITFNVTPPTRTTPNNAAFTLVPTLTGSNVTSATAPGVTFTPTATGYSGVNLSPNSVTVPPASTFKVTVIPGVSSSLGTLASEDGTSLCVLTVPDPLQYVSSQFGGAWNATARTVTWTLTQTPLQAPEVVFGVPAGTAPMTISPSATCSFTPIGEATPVSATGSFNVTVVTSLPVGSVFQEQAQSNITNVSSTPPVMVAPADDNPANLAEWRIVTRRQVVDLTDVTLYDRLPCLGNVANGAIESLSTGICTTPAFTVKDVMSDEAASITFFYTDGTSDTFANPGGVAVTTPTVGKVVSDIQVVFDYPGGSPNTSRVSVRGTPVAALATGAIIRNKVTATADPLAGSAIVSADMIITRGYLRVNASASSTTVDTAAPSASVSGSPSLSHSLSDAELKAHVRGAAIMPAGFTVSSPNAVNDWGGVSGQTLVRAAPLTTNMNVTLTGPMPEPGIYTWYFYYGFDDRDPTPGTCTGTSVTDATGLIAPVGVPRVLCRAEGTITVREAGSSVLIDKGVRNASAAGSTFQSYPALVKATTGDTVEFRIRYANVSGSAVTAAVVYDVFPRNGDTGTIGGLLSTSRGSTITPVLSTLDAAPSGWTMEYSRATNPCRPEVAPVNPGCVNDWSLTRGTLSTITAIRLIRASVPTGTTFAVTMGFTAPVMTTADVAYNTVAAAGSLPSGPLAATEAPRVGFASVPSFTVATAVNDDSGNWVDTTEVPYGSTASWRIIVTNTGSVTLTGAQVDGVAGSTCDRALPPLAPGASTTLLCSSDNVTMPVTNAVKVSVNIHGSVIDSVDSASVTVGPAPAPAVTVTKRAYTDAAHTLEVPIGGVFSAGDVIYWLFTVTNTGNVQLENISVVDPQLGVVLPGGVVCTIGSLEPTDSQTCSASSRP